jgi:hypothetical protein
MQTQRTCAVARTGLPINAQRCEEIRHSVEPALPNPCPPGAAGGSHITGTSEAPSVALLASRKRSSLPPFDGRRLTDGRHVCNIQHGRLPSLPGRCDTVQMLTPPSKPATMLVCATIRRLNMY